MSRWTPDDYKREVQRIRSERPLHVKQQIAASGQNPITGRWWPFWKPWHPTVRIRAIFSRFTRTTGRLAGMRRSTRKADAARANGVKGGPYGILGARHGIKGGRPRARQEHGK